MPNGTQKERSLAYAGSENKTPTQYIGISVMSESTHHARFVSRLTKQTMALILAGGRGSRLHDLTEWRAKPAVPFGGKFRIIDFPLSNCLNSGIRKIGVLTQYKADSLIRHLQRGWSFFRPELDEYVDIMPAQQRLQESWYEGTADAVYQNLDILRQRDVSYILILAGDHIYKMDYGLMLAYHAEQNADLTIGCMEIPVAEATAFGVMHVDAGQRVCAFVEKPENPPPMPNRPDHALASMGIYIFNAEFLYEKLIKDADSSTSSHDFGKDIIPDLIKDCRVFAYPFRDPITGAQAYWRDVGTVDAYWESNIELISASTEFDIYDPNWPIWTSLSQTPPGRFVTSAAGRRGYAEDSLVAGGCIISGGEVKRSVLFRNVRIEEGTTVEHAVILPEATIGAGCRIKKAIIDRGCAVPPGTVIGENIEADRERFFVSPNGVVLVTPDRFGQKIHFAR
jgi:glucose-1-phosphate adenylyltransferase